MTLIDQIQIFFNVSNENQMADGLEQQQFKSPVKFDLAQKDFKSTNLDLMQDISNKPASAHVGSHQLTETINRISHAFNTSIMVPAPVAVDRNRGTISGYL